MKYILNIFFFVNSNYMSILECPHYGYYGKNCENRCSVNCYVTRGCDRVTGRCKRGCKPGWTTATCKQSRYFGELLDVKATIVKHFEHTCHKESTHTLHLYVYIICIHILLYLSNMSLSIFTKLSFLLVKQKLNCGKRCFFHP